ncbi:META domain-containing protein [Pedobacter sp. Leaf176]|uniref:META domain-containing protein n=1 Tax=Pedobacter sp. Leaf176 TaxID=1736286 RepID=UPI0006FD7518|nr:META domain-containing protein [Pedobacter sp. Leaf176]KQR70746.1 hypothetical protein ASF92_12370 [Pedobacter sp. Leaf176]
MKNLLICGILLCFLSSCFDKFTPETLKNTKWELTEMTGKTLPTSAKATLNFNDSLRVSGKSFCNSYGGELDLKDDQTKLKNVYSTKMFCEATASAENTFLTALNETDHAKIVNGKLQLLKGGQTILIFSKID